MPLPWNVRFACLALALTLASCTGDLGPRQARFALDGLGGYTDFNAADAPLTLDPEPVLTPGAPGAWDSVDVLNPSIVFAKGKYYNLYSGYDGATWRTGLAVSTDTRTWRKHEENPILEPDATTWEGGYIAANGALVVHDHQLLYAYHAGPRNQAQIGVARSEDALRWTKHPEPILTTGPPQSWDESAVADPYLVEHKGWLYLFYLGQDRDGIQRIGVARSHDGREWLKSHANPILQVGGPNDFDARGLGEPAVVASRGRLLMLYTGRDAGERRTLGWAISADGITWQKAGRAEFATGAESWYSEVLCDATLWVEGDRLRFAFGGGDAPRPDENVNGAIGTGSAPLP